MQESYSCSFLFVNLLGRLLGTDFLVSSETQCRNISPYQIDHDHDVYSFQDQRACCWPLTSLSQSCVWVVLQEQALNCIGIFFFVWHVADAPSALTSTLVFQFNTAPQTISSPGAWKSLNTSPSYTCHAYVKSWIFCSALSKSKLKSLLSCTHT